MAKDGLVDSNRAMMSRGFSPNVADYDGRTPLHLAACFNQVDVVQFLLDHEVAISPVDRFGATPLDDAIKNGCERVVELIQAALEQRKHNSLPTRSVRSTLDRHHARAATPRGNALPASIPE
jgi:glutaminase